MDFAEMLTSTVRRFRRQSPVHVAPERTLQLTGATTLPLSALGLPMLLAGPDAAVSVLQGALLAQLVDFNISVYLLGVTPDDLTLAWPSAPLTSSLVQPMLVTSAEDARWKLWNLYRANRSAAGQTLPMVLGTARASQLLMDAGLLSGIRRLGVGMVLNLSQELPVVVLENLFGTGVFWPEYLPRALRKKLPRFEAARGYLWNVEQRLAPLLLDALPSGVAS